MKKLLLAALAAASLAACEPARAQSVQCSDRSAGDSTNACANTRFVMSNAGFWMADGNVAVNNSAVYPTVRITRSNVGDAGATLQLGHGNYMWTLIGNQLAGGDLILRNPAGGNVLVFPETGGCVGIQAALTSCAASFMLDIGPGGGNAWVRINGATFTNNQGPMLAFSGGGTVLGRIGADCVFYGATLCNNNVYVDGPASSRNFGFFNWAGVFITNTPTAAPTRYVGGALTVNTDSSNAFVGGNAITAQSDINTGGNFPTGLTISMNVRNTTTGGPGATVWGIYSHGDLHATTGLAEIASIEGTAGNRYGAPNVPPIATNPAPTQPFLSALKATCGALISNTPNLPGLFGCSVGVWVHYYEGNGGWPFLYGMYLTEGVATTTGIHVNANSSTPMATAAEFRSAGDGTKKGVVIRNMGATSSNLALDFQNSAGASVSSIQFNGAVNFNNGGVIQGINTFTHADPSGFTLQVRSISNPAMTLSRILTLDVSNADRTIDLSGNLTIGGTFSTTGTFSSGGNFSTSSTFSVTGALSIGGAFTTSGAVTISTFGASLVDDADATAARTTLGLGTAATQNTGTSGATLPFLNGTNTWAAAQTFSVSGTWGAGTGSILNVINGGNSGANGGAAIATQNAGATIIGMGNKSPFLGAGYDATPIIFSSTSPMVVYLGADRFYFYSSGGLSLNTNTDPGAGQLYTNSATFMIRTKTSYTNGAGAGAGTITNAPAAGNPTKWIPVDDNGTTRYVPAW